MNNFKIHLFNFSIIFLFSFCSGFAQTIEQTKQYIMGKIESFPPIGSRTEALFADGALYGDAKNFTGVDFDKEIQSRLLIYVNTYIVDNQPFGSIVYTFDVKGISTLNVSTELGNDGYTKYNVLNIHIKSRYICRSRVGKRDSQYKSLIQIPLNLSIEELEKLKSSFIHLSILYGGNPVLDDLFNK
jgi:hypothetical protein